VKPLVVQAAIHLSPAPVSKIIALMEARNASVDSNGSAKGKPRKAAKKSKTRPKAKARSALKS